ncbi:MAG: hypothetical protein JJ975_05880 [Bacteroidia bacterium]|nr:hypothetical protein [Bacteroidia bacterium]
MKEEFRSQENIKNYKTQKTHWQPGGKGEKPKKYYGIESGGRPVKRFHLIKKNGIPLCVPYALLPLVTMDAQSNLLIVSHDLKITIKGRNMKKLYDAFGGEAVMWIKESDTEMDDESEDVFVQTIIIASKLLG